MAPVDRVARIRIELDGIDPAVWRTVEVALSTSLTGLHEVIQAVMLFDNCHLFQFDVGTKRYAIPDPEWEDVRVTHHATKTSLRTLIDGGFKIALRGAAQSPYSTCSSRWRGGLNGIVLD